MMDKASKCDLKLKINWKDILNQKAIGKIHNSRKGFWKLWKPVEREIMNGSKIHKSVFDRIQSRGLNYNPKIPNEHETVQNSSYESANKPNINGN